MEPWLTGEQDHCVTGHTPYPASLLSLSKNMWAGSHLSSPKPSHPHLPLSLPLCPLSSPGVGRGALRGGPAILRWAHLSEHSGLKIWETQNFLSSSLPEACMKLKLAFTDKFSTPFPYWLMIFGCVFHFREPYTGGNFQGNCIIIGHMN